MTSPVWLTGFEYGFASPTVSGGGLFDALAGAVSVQGTVKNTGGYALEVVEAGAAAYCQKTISGNVAVGRVYFRFKDALPADGLGFLSVWNSYGTHALFTVNGGGYLYAGFYGNTTNDQHWATALQVNTWYRLDFYCDVTNLTRTLDWQVNGAAQTQASRTTARTDPHLGVRFGWNAAVTMDVFFDDVVVSYTAADYPIGAGGTELLLPSADGTHSNGTNELEDKTGADINGTTVTAFSQLNTVPMGGTVAYIQQNAANGAAYVGVTFADISAAHASIIGAEAVLAYRAATATGDTAGCIVTKDNFSTTTTVWGAPGAEADYSEASVFWKSVIVAGAVDDTTVNALAARVGYSSDATPDPWWLDLAVEVAYVVSTNPTGTASITEAADTISSSGAVAVAGSAGITEANDTTSQAGAVAVSGSASITEAVDTISAAGTVAAVTYTGTASITEAADTISSAGAVAVAGSSSITEAANTTAAAGTVLVSGSAGITEAVDTISAAGTESVTGTAAITEAADTISASGTVGSLPLAGDANITEAADTISASGAVAVTGSAAISEAADTITAAGSVPVYGTAPLTEAADTISATGIVSSGTPVTGNASITESADTISSSGAVTVSGSASITEAADTITTAGAVAVYGTSTLTEAADSISASGTVGDVTYTGAADITEAADIISAAGYVLVYGTADITETADSLTASGGFLVAYQPTAHRISVSRSVISVGREHADSTRKAISAGKREAVEVSREEVK